MCSWVTSLATVTVLNLFIALFSPVVQDSECVLGADLFTDELEILSASVGFDGIIGVPLNEADVVAAGGAWDSDLSVCPSSPSEPVPTNLRTSAVSGVFVPLLWDCERTPDHEDGFPVCFSWPVLPSSVRREHVLYERSDGRTFHPNCVSVVPNNEFNERHCIVMFDDFINREDPAIPGTDPLLMKRIDVVGDLMFVGPNGTLHSGKGLYRIAEENESPYSTGPRFVAARLSPLRKDDEGEGTTNSNNQIGIFPNSGTALFGGEDGDGDDDDDNDTLYRLRLFYSGGMTPDGVRSFRPDLFDDYFTLVFRGGEEIDRTNVPVPVADGKANVTVLGVADVGVRLPEYDVCYNEDRDNYLDVVLRVRTRDDDDDDDVAAAVILNETSHVRAFDRNASLYNPGGPGATPTFGVRYTAPAPPNQTVTVRVDAEDRYKTTYCESRTGKVSTDADVCRTWRNENDLRNVPIGTPRYRLILFAMRNVLDSVFSFVRFVR